MTVEKTTTCRISCYGKLDPGLGNALHLKKKLFLFSVSSSQREKLGREKYSICLVDKPTNVVITGVSM